MIYNFLIGPPSSATNSTTTVSGSISAGDLFEIRLDKLGTDTDSSITYYVCRARIYKNGTVVKDTGTSPNSSLVWIQVADACAMNTFSTMQHNSSVDPNGKNEYDNFEVWQL